MIERNPTLAIDLPLGALVWQDDDGRVWLLLNTADFPATEICARHGMSMPFTTRTQMAQMLTEIGQTATQ